MRTGDRELIDLYLRHELQGDALDKFLAQLPGDTVLRRELESLQALLPAIHESGRAMLKTKLQTIEASLPALGEYTPAQNDRGKLPARKNRWGWKVWVAIAAGVMVIAAAAFFIWKYTQHHDHEGMEGGADHEGEYQQPAVAPQPAPATDSAKADTGRSQDLPAPAAAPAEPGGGETKLKMPGMGNMKSKSEEVFYPRDTIDKNPGVVIDDDRGEYFTGYRSEVGDLSSVSAKLRGAPPTVIRSDPKFPYHYKFTDTLFLYGPFSKDLIVWGSEKVPLMLFVDDKKNGLKRYALKPTRVITSLKTVEVAAASSGK